MATQIAHPANFCFENYWVSHVACGPWSNKLGIWTNTIQMLIPRFFPTLKGPRHPYLLEETQNSPFVLGKTTEKG
jgi:hypothetical protein